MRTPKPAHEPFTSADVKRMTSSEIADYWVRRQQYLRASGQAHYTTLRNSDKRGEIVATIDGAR